MSEQIGCELYDMHIYKQNSILPKQTPSQQPHLISMSGSKSMQANIMVACLLLRGSTTYLYAPDIPTVVF